MANLGPPATGNAVGEGVPDGGGAMARGPGAAEGGALAAGAALAAGVPEVVEWVLGAGVHAANAQATSRTGETGESPWGSMVLRAGSELAQMTPLDQRRFLFVTGKGGVGKSTVTAALAVALAARGKRVLVTACDAKERISLLLGSDPLTPEVAELRERLWAVKLIPQVALREYGGMVLKSEIVFGAVFDNKYVRQFFAGVPGLHEWAMLGKAWFHSIEETSAGRPRFDVVIFDAPATGHGLDMLRVPKVIVDVVPPGVLRRDAERAWTMFQDPVKSGVVVVTLPEDMPTNETIELYDALQNELSLPIAALVVNGVIDEVFDEVERSRLLSDLALDRTQSGDEAIACGIRRSIRERVQAQSLSRLRALGGARVELPLLRKDAATPEAIAELSARF